MGRKRVEEKHTPVLNRHLLEGAFAQCMSQVLMSLDECNKHKEGKMSLDDHVRALWVIAKDELGIGLMIVENISDAALIRKHRLWKRRAVTCMDMLNTVDPDTQEGLRAILNGIVHWIQDAHLILHEDTDDETREYLANKFLTEVESDDQDQAKSVVGIQ